MFENSILSQAHRLNIPRIAKHQEYIITGFRNLLWFHPFSTFFKEAFSFGSSSVVDAKRIALLNKMPALMEAHDTGADPANFGFVFHEAIEISQ